LDDVGTILVVEDDQLIQALVEDALSDGGFQSAISASGEEAITLLRGETSQYRAVVTDINLVGKLDGWEVARWFGRSPEPVINRHPKRTPTVIDRAWDNWPPSSDLQDQTQNIVEVVMSSRSERGRARARLQQETPIADDASLLAWQEEAAAIVRDAKHGRRSGSDELPLTVLDEVARSYFRHVHRHR
jgi:CheY-like chemotaxis protein